MNAGPSGFQNAAVTKGVVIVVGIVSLLVGTQGGARACSLSYQAIFRKLQLWRFITTNFVFSTTPELIFGLYLIYFFRVFERQLGSNKYSVYVLFSAALTTCLEVVALAAIRGLRRVVPDLDASAFGRAAIYLLPLDYSETTIALPTVFGRDPTSSGISLSPGPYGLIFASFIPFFFDIPVSTRFRVLNVTFSDKSFVYLAGLQLLLSSWKRSLIPGLCGVLAGLTYRSNILGVRRIKFPEGLAAGAAKLFHPLLASVASSTTGPNQQAVRAPGTREAANQTLTGRPSEGRFAAPPASVAALFPPSEESVSTLVAMGFDRSMALQALARSRNDLMLATNLLLEAQAH